MAERVRVKGLAAAIEAVYGTAETIDPATDGIQVEENLWADLTIDYLEANLREGAAVSGLGRSLAAQPGGRYGNLRVAVALKGVDGVIDASNAPEWDVLARACGLTPTFDATASSEAVTYTPRSSAFESATVRMWSAGGQYEMVGVRGNLDEIRTVAGQIAVLVFDLWGLITADPTDAAIPGTLAYAQQALKPPLLTGAGLTMNGFTPADFASFTFQMRSEVVERARGNAPEGHAGYEITDWDPHFNVVIDKPPLATFNPYALRKSATSFAWTVDVDTNDTAPQYNQITIAGPAGVIAGTPHEDDRGYAMMNLLVRCQNDAGDDAFTITVS